MPDHPSGPSGEPATGDPAPSDRSLLARFQRGQSDASTALYLRYARRLEALAAAKSGRDVARRVEPEDIVQSVFRTFFRRASEGLYEVPDGEDLWKLLLVIALNKVRTAATHHRAAKRDVRQTADGAPYEAAVEDRAGRDQTAIATLKMVIDEVLDQLPEAQRRIIELRFEGHEVAEIADQVGRSKRSVERVLQDFRKRLAAQVDGDG